MRMTIGRKLTFGFAAMVVLIGSMFLGAVLSNHHVERSIARTHEMAQASQLMSEKITDHFKWLDKLNGTFVQNLEGVNVQLDDHQCALGKWLYGEDAQRLADSDPEAAQLIEKLKQPHNALHTSGQKIKEVWQQQNEGLRTALWSVLETHAQWSRQVGQAIIAKEQSLDVNLDHTTCGFGRFLKSEFYKHGSPQLKQTIEPIIKKHRELHESARLIGQSLERNDHAAASAIYAETTMPCLAAIGRALHEVIDHEERVHASQSAARKILRTETTAHLHATQDVLEQLRDHLARRGDETRAELHQIIERTQQVNATVTGTAVIFAVVVGLWITLSILKPINAMMKVMPHISAGDLTRTVLVRSKDQLGDLARAFNELVGRFRESLGEVSSATHEVASATTQIAASSEQMAAGMKAQSEQTVQVSSAVEEMSSTVVEVARKSAETASTAEAAGKQATDGGEVVKKTVVGMNEISRVVQTSSQTVCALGKRSEEIGQIIDVINDIADQTNLLALNAAIEAARAGEHGRGFAVVADEVRKLSERTTQATEEVGRSIKAIQDETNAVVVQMQTGTERVEAGMELAEAAGASLEAILTGSGQVSTMIQSIAAAAEEQSAVAEQISKNVEAISAVTSESAQGADQAACAASQLSAKAEQLQELVGRFKIGI